MSNHYSPATVTPNIPCHFITRVERMMLEAFGFEFEDAESSDEYFIFASQFVCGDGTICVSRNAVRADRTPFESELLNLMGHFDVEDDVEIEFFIGETVGYSEILFEVLKRSQGELGEIIIEGAETRDVIVPGAYGGWVARITADGFNYFNTGEWLDKERQARPVGKPDGFYVFKNKMFANIERAVPNALLVPNTPSLVTLVEEMQEVALQHDLEVSRRVDAYVFPQTLSSIGLAKALKGVDMNHVSERPISVDEVDISLEIKMTVTPARQVVLSISDRYGEVVGKTDAEHWFGGEFIPCIAF